MIRKFNIWLFVAVVVILPVSVFAVVDWYEKKVKPLPVLINKDHRIGDFKLINQRGSIATIKDWEIKIVVADFFFTRCPSICPKMTRSLKKVQDATSKNKNVLITSFTVDPEHDSAPVMRQYIKKVWHQRKQLVFDNRSKKRYLSSCP